MEDKEMKKLMILAMIAAAVMAVIDLTYENKVQPDSVYPMANQNIRWEYAKGDQ